MKKEEKYPTGERVTWIGAIGNVLLSIIKFIAGIVGHSEALVADAVHSLSDLVTDIVVLVSLKFSKKPVDETHPYGHGRVETVGTGILGVILVAVAVTLFWEAVGTIKAGVNYIPTYTAVFGALISIVVKEWMYRYTVRAGRRINSSSLVANAWHHRTDALSSIATLFGVGAAMMGWPIFDPIAALIVTFLILKVGWNTMKDAFMDIIDTAVTKDVRDSIVSVAMGTEGVLGYHDLKTRKMGSEILVDIDIEVSADMSVTEAHNIAVEVRNNIREGVEHIADVLVHIDPEGENEGIIYSPSNNLIEKEIKKAAEGISGISCCREIKVYGSEPELTVHLTAGLSSELTIKEGYEKISELKKKVLEIDRITDVQITADLNSK